MTDIEIPVGKRQFWYRFFEILPGFLSYLILALPVLLSLINPLWGALFVILFVITWLVKAIGISFRTFQGYNHMEQAKKIDWQARLEDLAHPAQALDKLQKKRQLDYYELDHLRRLHHVVTEGETPNAQAILNAVIVATVDEGREVLEPTIKSLIDSDYDTKKNMILLLAYEERAGEATKTRAEQLIKEYNDQFYYAAAVGHPAGIEYEVIGKGGNITFAGRYLQTYLEKHAIDPQRVMVTTLDADNRPHRTYFAYLTYLFLTTVNPHQKAYQPNAVFTNNIWDVPAPMRVIATGNSFWNIVNSQRPHMLRNFASHSQSMAALLQTDFWSVRSIVEDGHQYWRSYFTFDGNYEVIPIVVPIYQDAVLSTSFTRTLKAQFIQVRRWAYGASDIPYVATMGFRKNRSVPLWDFLGKLLRLIDSHVSWATVALITAFGAWAPLFFGNEADKSIVAHQLPVIASWAQRVAMIGLVISIFFAMRILPPRPERYKRHRNIFMILQWLYMPFTSIVYGSLAAFYSQTRLMLGKYVAKFDVTEKVVKSD